MMRRFTALLLAAALGLCLCGCGSVFDREYVVESAYIPAAQPGAGDSASISVDSFSKLKQTLLDMVSAGESERRLTFDTAYAGDVPADMASACWEVRTQDALCAYCVENIAYELSQIVTYYEATVTVSYSGMVPAARDILHLQYATGLEDVIKKAVEQGQNRLAVLISRSSYSAEDMELLVSRIYREEPRMAPREPGVSVNLFSGTGTQRLYEINLRYGLTAQELENRKAEMTQVLESFAAQAGEETDRTARALAALEYLAGSCLYEEDGQADSIYSALVQGRAGSEGMALAYVELCASLDVPCQIVYGQRNWQDYCWNIVQLDGDYYHVDPALCAAYGPEWTFLLGDEDVWGVYRWDTASYPACGGPLSYGNPG